MPENIRVMPTFGNDDPEGFKKPKKHGSLGIILVIVFLILIGAAIGAFFMLSPKSSSPSETQKQASPVIDTTKQAQEETTKPVLNPSRVTLFDLKTPGGRDSQRIFDIKGIGEELSKYANEHSGIFPPLLNDISSDKYEIPKDPGSFEYVYEISDDGNSYAIKFELEFGATDGFTYLTMGKYVFTKEGISKSTEEADTTNGIDITNQPNDETNTDIVSNPEETAPEQNNTPTLLIESIDTDFDGLTDFEEAILRSDDRVADTDKDGFIDGVETMNLYDPTSLDGKLEDSTLVRRYSNRSFNYTFLYPALWKLKTLDTGERSVSIDTETGEKIQVLVQDNPNGLSTNDWYLSNSPGATRNDFQEISKGFIKGIKTLDGLNVYFADATHVFIITYNPQLQKEFRYPKMFEMLIRSLVFN